MNAVFETLMLICFGISWPISLVKHIRSGTAKGTSITFTVFIIIGYLSGITAKLISNSFTGLSAFIYMLNLTMVSLDLAVFFINRHKDKLKSKINL